MIWRPISDEIDRFFAKHCGSMDNIYQLPVPRLTEKDAAFWPIAKRAAGLIYTTPEFDDLAKEVGMKSHKDGATDPVERAKLRAELESRV